VFGVVFEGLYEEDKYFLFDFAVYYQIYIGFLPIVKFLSGKSNRANGILLQHNNICYKWRITKESTDTCYNVIFESDNYSLNFSLEELNDLVYLITQTCFISLDLNYETLLVFETLSTSEVDKVLQFLDKKKLIAEMKSLSNFELSEMKLHFVCELVYYNLDVIIGINKLKTLFNEKLFICQSNIQKILNYEKEIAEKN
jgi:predicted DNA-binding ArsR family transcriptional regulator